MPVAVHSLPASRPLQRSRMQWNSPHSGDAKRRFVVNAGSVVFAVAIDGIFVAIGVIGVVMIAAALFRVRHRQPARANRTDDGWRNRAAGVSTAGREVIDLTADGDYDELGGGLTVDQLSVIETRLDLLIAQIHDVQAIAPTPEDARRMQLAELHARSLHETVSTIRRWRLKSAASTPERFDTLALQLTAHRSALDDVLREISHATGRES